MRWWIDSVGAPTGTAREVLYVFLRLGCLSFGGPIAHLGYFHKEFVDRRKWCVEEIFAEVVALSQSMPGPASSQVAFTLGLLRAGWPGALAAWVGFTMPSAILMLAFAFGRHLLTGNLGLGIIHGLQLVAVAVVAQAILAMRKSLAPDAPRMALALLAAAIAFFAPPAIGTILAIAAGALFGIVELLKSPGGPHSPSFGQCGVAENSPTALPPRSCPPPLELPVGLPKLAGLVAAFSFVALLFLSPLAAALTSSHQSLDVFSAFYRIGALVFGGGHVVLPLLENAIVARGWITQSSFLSGYGAAQALPGPLFAFAAYLGASIQPSFNPVALSAIALIAIFLPGLLIIVAVLPFWNSLRQRPMIQSALRGVNASVVGVLIAAFIRPVWGTAIHSVFDFAIAAVAFALFVCWKVSPWIVVVAVASVSAIASII